MSFPSTLTMHAIAAILVSAVSAPAAIIIDGVNRGSNYTLRSSANSVFLTAADDILRIRTNINGNLTLDAVTDSSVNFTEGNVGGSFDFTGGNLRIARNANINGGLDIRSGNVDIRGGNISGGIDLFAGIVSLNATQNVNINGDINASGGGFFADRTSNLNGNINFSGNAVGFFGNEARNVNGSLIVADDAAVYMTAPRSTIFGTDADGRVTSPVGLINGLGNNILYTTTLDRNLFLNVDRSDALTALAAMTPAAVPEPTRALTALLGFSAALFARRRK